MKRSEELKQLAVQEDNDLKAMGHLTKALREKRDENFEDRWLGRLQVHPEITYLQHIPSQVKYTIVIKEKGTFDLYPKANKLLERAKNKWHKPGLRYLLKILKIR
jgi:hypothetical protein